MKRGKRQIVEQPILFGSQDSPSQKEHPTPTFYNNQYVNNKKVQTTTSQQGIINNINHKQQRQNNVNGGHNQKSVLQVQQKNDSTVKQNNKAVETKVSQSADDQRKKRLEMLRQKFLKKGPSNQTQKNNEQKEVPQRKIETLKGNQIPINVKKAHNTQVYKSQIKSNQVNGTPSIKYESNIQHRQRTEQNPVSKNAPTLNLQPQYTQKMYQNEAPFSKPTSQSLNSSLVVEKPKRVVPPAFPAPPQRTNKRTPPPPPVQKVNKSAIQRDQEIPAQRNQEKQIFMNTENVFKTTQRQNEQKFQLKAKEPPKSRINKVKKPQIVSIPQQQQIYPKSNIKYKSQNNNQTSSLLQAVQEWINYSPNTSMKIQCENQQKIQQLVDQISLGNDSYVKNIIQIFLINNKIQYSLEQSKFVSQQIQKKQSWSQLVKLFLSIKCGADTLQQTQSKIDPQYLPNLLSDLVTLKARLLQTETNQFLTHYLQSPHFTEQSIPTLLQLSTSTSSPIFEFLKTFNFQHQVNAARTLVQLKNYLGNDQILPVYFRLVNVVVGGVADLGALERVLKLVNEVTGDGAYQLKKDTKKRIIQKIDRDGRPEDQSKSNNPSQIYNNQPKQNEQQFRISQNNPNPNLNNKQQKDQKGLGINIMGYVNQALKKITSQIPEINNANTNSNNTNNSSSVVEEPKESIVWDPVLGRYLINGKVPEDENGSVFDSTNANENKQKKRPPPPPPRPGIKPKQATKQKTAPVTQKVATQAINMQSKSWQKSQISQQNEEQYTRQQQNSGFSNGNQDQSPPKTTKIPQPPARVGVKGLTNKRPKVQARYA